MIPPALIAMALNPIFGIDPVKFARALNEIGGRVHYRWTYSLRRYQGHTYIVKRTTCMPCGIVHDLKYDRIGSVMAVVKDDDDPLPIHIRFVKTVEPGWWKARVSR